MFENMDNNCNKKCNNRKYCYVIGPTGPASGASAYGERYSNTPQIIPLTQDVEAVVPLEQTGPSLNTSYLDTHSVTINKQGLYLVLYHLSAAPSMDGNLTVSVRLNGAKIPGSEVNSEGILLSLENNALEINEEYNAKVVWTIEE